MTIPIAWQSIEAAPGHPMDVLMYWGNAQWTNCVSGLPADVPDGVRYEVGYWDGAGYYYHGSNHEVFEDKDRRDPADMPTHWQPLAAPPSLLSPVSVPEIIPTDAERERAAVLKAYRARITELEAKQRGGSYEETYKALAQADVKRAEEERDTAYARGLKDAAKIADGFDPPHWWDTTDEIEGRLAQGIARAIRAKTEGKG